VYEVAPLIKQSALERAVVKAKDAVATAREIAAATPGKVMKAKELVTSPEVHARLREDAELLRDVVAGKAKDRFKPLVEKLLGSAIFENNPEVAHIVRYEGEPIAAE
jgi:hypothetical protein